MEQGLTLETLFNGIASNPAPVMLYFFMLLFTTVVANFMSGDEAYESPWTYMYSALVYMACVPGILAIVLCVYTLVFVPRLSLLQVNSLVYFMPILVMIATLFLISRKVKINQIPGFDKLSGLLTMLAAIFITILIIQKTRIWVIFHGSIKYLIGLFVVLFIVFRWGMYKMMAPESKTSSGGGSKNSSNGGKIREIDW